MSSLDTFLKGMSTFCSYLMPAAGLVILIYLALFVKELISTLKSLTKTLDTANDRLKQLDGPLSTVDQISQTIDEVHIAAKDVAMKTAQSISTKVEEFKTKQTERAAEPIIEVEPAPQVQENLNQEDKEEKHV